MNEPVDVTIHILTLTGELVYSHTVISGNPGATSGLQTIMWNGCNDDGDLVLNGVYIAMLTTSDGDVGSLKVAVQK